MNFFKKTTTWSNAEFIVFKLSLASVYVLIGGYFHRFFGEYYIPVIILFVITVCWTLYLWISKMKKNN
ncbi:MAG: hypothetical protein NTZ33_03780 [Bacteroidetes bacterium]|nr:hypothetical protein [Bacteroidota bacterium]